MIYLKQSLIILIVSIFAIACCDNGDDDVNACGTSAIVDDNMYNNGPSDQVEIMKVEIDGDCMMMTIAASGCDGDTWGHSLVGSTDVAESLPPQRNIRLALTNTEACLAYLTKEVIYDLTPLRVDGEVSVILHLQGHDGGLLYEF